MKAKITRKDGTVIELEGTAEELARFVEPPRVEIKGTPAPAVDLGKLLEEVAKQDKQVPQAPWRAPHCPGIVPLPFKQPFTFDGWDPCSIGFHDFPSCWLGVNPPACTRCGAQAAPYQLVCTNEALSGLRFTVADQAVPGTSVPLSFRL